MTTQTRATIGRLRGLIFAPMAAAFLLPTAPAGAAPILSFTTPDAIEASAVTAGSDAVILGLYRTREGWLSRNHLTLEAVRDADGDGNVAWQAADIATHRRARWAVVDLSSGAAAFGTPSEAADAPLMVDPALATTIPGFLRFERAALHVLVVRPGVGAWHGRADDGGRVDAGVAHDGIVVLDLARLAVLPESMPGRLVDLTDLQAGDCVIGIDPQTFEQIHFTVPASSALF